MNDTDYINELNIREADRLEVTILVDNYTDMLVTESTDICKRPLLPLPHILLAKHGLSCLIKIFAGAEEHTVLMDAAVTPSYLFHNARLLKVDLSELESIILSHGHPDHFLGLEELLKFLNEKGRKEIPLFLHPESFLERHLNIPAVGSHSTLPALDEGILKAARAIQIKSEKPAPLAGGLLYTTGEVERTTAFEKGFPWAEARFNGKWVTDPFRDDKGLVMKLKGKGLVVISGCAHAGTINTVEYAKKLAGTDKVYAVLGGFHLTGRILIR